MEALPGEGEQDRLLTEAKQAIKRHAYQMRKAMEEDSMREALRFSAAMLGELRTSQLYPQNYYELYMLVFDQLVNLESLFADEHAKGKTYAELYELVQHAGNVLPRLYLMVVVGCLYIRSQESRAKDVLKDLVELCKGVQHPTRGLFLRAYLCQKTRGLVPDAGSPYEGEGGNVHDALDFLLTNFIEMNKLWVRMQHQGSVRDKERREKERQQLSDLVGKNLTYISQLDGLGYELYASMVLPRVMEQIVSCKDEIAQQYLFQAVIQGFPDSFHLGTLDTLLGALPELQPGVKIHSVLAQLMDRLARYASTDVSAMQRLLEMNAFVRFRDAIAAIINAQASMPAADAVEMFVALMNFTGSVHPNIVDNVNQVLAAAYKALAPKGLSGDSRAEKQLVALLTIPLTKFDVVTGLGLSEYPLLMGLLRHRTHKDLATRIINTIVQSGTKIASVEKVHMLFRFIQPLVFDAGEGVTQAEGLDDEDVEQEQSLVATLLHHLAADDAEQHFAILAAAREQLTAGGQRRLRHTLPALGFETLQLVRRVTEGGKAPSSSPSSSTTRVTAEQLLQWLLSCCVALSEVPEPVMALRLLLAGALSASEEAQLEMLAYEFFEQAFLLYEESCPEQRVRITALQSILGTLHRCHVFTPDNRDTLAQNAAGYASKLLKRSDQCKAVCACSHLSWQDEASAAASSSGEAAAAAAEPSAEEGSGSSGRQPPVRDANRVMACLKRALKIANSAKQQAAASARSKEVCSYLGLYVEILNHYLFYMDAGAELFTPGVVQQIMELIANELQHGVGAMDAESLKYLQNTVKHISATKAKEGDLKAKYAALNVPAAVLAAADAPSAAAAPAPAAAAPAAVGAL